MPGQLLQFDEGRAWAKRLQGAAQRTDYAEKLYWIRDAAGIATHAEQLSLRIFCPRGGPGR
eukprot:1097877-Pelagomonas_calceolata.AAC.2